MNKPPTNDPGRKEHGSHVTEEVCLALLNALLSSEERDQVVSHLSACPSCEKMFAQMAIEREDLRASMELEFGPDGELLQHRLREPIAAGSEPSGVGPLQETWPEKAEAFWNRFLSGFRRPRHQFGLGLAATIAVVLILLWPRGPETPDTTLHWLTISDSGSSVRTSVEMRENPDLADGIEAYAARDLKRAIDVLRKTEASGQQEIARRIFLASSLALEGEHTEAVSILESVDAWSLPDPWGAETLWTLYVSLSKTGEQASADSLLRVLATKRGEVGDRARRLIDSSK